MNTIVFNNIETKPTPTPTPKPTVKLTEEKYEDDDDDVCDCRQDDDLINYTIYLLIILIFSKFFLKSLVNIKWIF